MQQIIAKIEDKWLTTLSNYLIEEFSKIHLPSHDEKHHERVWVYAKDLLLALYDTGETHAESFIEQLIIAVFFHDLGMVKSTQPDHGLLGRRMAEKFLVKANLNLNDYSEALQAIEQHDDKEYQFTSDLANIIDIYTILTIADDLDAFGAIGIFRYLEIYYYRKIPVENLRRVILRNLEARFTHFANRMKGIPEFVEKHHKRLMISKELIQILDLLDLQYIIELFKQEVDFENFRVELSVSSRPKLSKWSKKMYQELLQIV